MKRHLFLLSMLFIFSSCESQVGQTVTGAFKNIISGNIFPNSSANDAYEKMKGNMQARPSATITPTCNTFEDIIPMNKNVAGNMSKIKDKICSCEAWGSCDSKSCSCEMLCPKDFKIFKKLDGNLEAPENNLSFTNKINKFDKLKSYSGYCWGITMITQRFNRMATFDESAPKKFQGAGQDRARIAEYKNIIARLNNNEVVTIPGFKNLLEFSSDPEVKDLLEDSVKDLWQENATTAQGLGMVTGSSTPSKSEMNNLFDDVEFRLQNNMSPALVYNESGARTNAHVLLVHGSGKIPSTGERYLCLNDNNNRPFQNQDCNVKMILKNDGSVIRKYGDKDWNNEGEPIVPIKLGKIAMTHSENPNAMEQMTNLQIKCAGEKGCPKAL